MKKFLIIADIAGQYDALLRLVDLVPKDTILISVGDMCDRGPQSKEVINFFKDDKDRIALAGNHELMMLDWLRGVHTEYASAWLRNGGDTTVLSYSGLTMEQLREMSWWEVENRAKEFKVPEETLEWIDELPIAIELEGNDESLFISHAPLSGYEDLFKKIRASEPLNCIDKNVATWVRGVPDPVENMLQVFGHNSNWGLYEFTKDDKPFAICIDQSRSGKLTGFLWPEKKVIEVPYEKEAV